VFRALIDVDGQSLMDFGGLRWTSVNFGHHRERERARAGYVRPLPLRRRREERGDDGGHGHCQGAGDAAPTGSGDGARHMRDHGLCR
jgi:hypothetical protein